MEIRPHFRRSPNSKIWNPVKLKMMRGEKVTGGTVFASSGPSTYYAMANAGYDFIWTEMQHDWRDWENVAKMWQACPHAKAVPGVRVAYAGVHDAYLTNTFSVRRTHESGSSDILQMNWSALAL